MSYLEHGRYKNNKNYVVIELKKNQTSDDTVGQLARYMGWIKEHKKDFNRDKIISYEYRIEYSDSKFVKATTDIRDAKAKHTIEVNLNEKTIKSTLETKSHGGVSSFSLYQYCGGSGGSKDFLNKIIGK